MSYKSNSVQFILIVLVNIVTKSIFLDNSPFSFDEIISVKDTLLDFGHIKHESEWDNNPPFYYYCLWVWHQLIPISEFNSRFLSVLLVSFAIGIFYQFIKKHFGLTNAIISVALLSLSNFITFYSQETRGYSLVFFLTALSTNCFYWYLKDPNIKRLLLHSLISFLLIYTHYIASLIVVFQFIFILLFYKSFLKKYFTINFLVISILVFLRFTKKQWLNILNFNQKDDFWLKKAQLHDLTDAISQLYYNQILGCVFILSLIIFFFRSKKYEINNQYKIMVYCLGLGFFSVFFLFLVGVFKAIFLSRYLIFCVPFATIFCISVFQQFNKIGFYICLCIIAVSFYKINIYKESTMNYKTVAQWIQLFKKKDEIVIINKRDNILLFEYYYDKEKFMKYRNIDSLTISQGVYGMNDTIKFNEIDQTKFETIFLFQSFHTINSSTNVFDDYLKRKFNKVYTTNYLKGVELNIYKIKGNL